MGMPTGLSNSSSNTDPPNPHPKKFRIIYRYDGEYFCLLQIHYYGCTNFGGVKISIYQKESADIGIKKGFLDPHFINSVSPVARFHPNYLEEALFAVKIFDKVRKDSHD